MEKPTLGERRLKIARLSRSRSTSNMIVATSGFTDAFRDNLRDDTVTRDQTSANSVTRPNDAKKWSIKSLRKEWKARTPPQSISHLHNTNPGKTHGGHHQVAISLPNQYKHVSRSRSQTSSSAPLERAASRQEWPERSSSKRDWSHLPMTDFRPKTLPQINRSDNVQTRRQPSVKKEEKPAANFQGSVFRYGLAAHDERFTTDHVFINRNAATRQKLATLKEKSTSSPTVAVQRQERGPGQPGQDYTSHRGLSLSTKTIALSTLTAPRDTSLPESPGFPKMLASVTFPSPPTRSRSSSPQMETDSRVNHQAPLVIRRRTSSKRTPTSNSGIHTASLDELIMQSTCPILSGVEPSGNSHDLEGINITGVVIPGAVAITKTAQEIDDARSQLSSASSFTTSTIARCNSAASTTSDKANSVRQSLVSNTATIASPLTPPTTNESYNLLKQSPSVARKPPYPALNKVISDTERNHHYFTHPSKNSSPNPGHQIEGENPPETGTQGYKSRPYRDPVIESLTSTSANGDTGSRRSIVERRMARKTKVETYKKRDLNAAGLFVNTVALGSTNLQPKDSPILGRFSKVPCPRELPSPQVTMIDLSLTVPTRTEDLVFSHVMNTEIKPEDYSSLTFSSPTTVNEIALSPIIVVSDQRPQEGPRTLLNPTIISQSIRQSPKPPRHSLKIITQSRRKSIPIVIHKNPANGDIERIASTTNKPNRHSLNSIHLSADASSLRRRSHPTGIFDPEAAATQCTPKDEALGVVAAVQQNTDNEKHEKKIRIGLRTERLQKEKLSKEQEISKLVAETLGASRRKDRIRQPPEDQITEEIERRLQRLEKDGGAWLDVLNSSLNNMSKTLEELRGNDQRESLIRKEFTSK